MSWQDPDPNTEIDAAMVEIDEVCRASKQLGARLQSVHRDVSTQMAVLNERLAAARARIDAATEQPDDEEEDWT